MHEKCSCGQEQLRHRSSRQRLANYEARLRQKGLVLPVLNAMAGGSILYGAGYSWVTQPGADVTCNPLLMGELGSAWKNAPTSCLLMLSSHL